MGGSSPQQDTKEEVTLNLPAALVCQIAERASAMNVSVDAAAVVLLQYGLKVQEQRERDIEALVEKFHNSPDKASRDSAFEEIGQSVFRK